MSVIPQAYNQGTGEILVVSSDSGGGGTPDEYVIYNAATNFFSSVAQGVTSVINTIAAITLNATSVNATNLDVNGGTVTIDTDADIDIQTQMQPPDVKTTAQIRMTNDSQGQMESEIQIRSAEIDLIAYSEDTNGIVLQTRDNQNQFVSEISLISSSQVTEPSFVGTGVGRYQFASSVGPALLRPIYRFSTDTGFWRFNQSPGLSGTSNNLPLRWSGTGNGSTASPYDMEFGFEVGTVVADSFNNLSKYTNVAGATAVLETLRVGNANFPVLTIENDIPSTAVTRLAINSRYNVGGGLQTECNTTYDDDGYRTEHTDPNDNKARFSALNVDTGAPGQGGCVMEVEDVNQPNDPFGFYVRKNSQGLNQVIIRGGPAAFHCRWPITGPTQGGQVLTSTAAGTGTLNDPIILNWQ